MDYIAICESKKDLWFDIEYGSEQTRLRRKEIVPIDGSNSYDHMVVEDWNYLFIIRLKLFSYSSSSLLSDSNY